MIDYINVSDAEFFLRDAWGFLENHSLVQGRLPL